MEVKKRGRKEVGKEMEKESGKIRLTRILFVKVLFRWVTVVDQMVSPL